MKSSVISRELCIKEPMTQAAPLSDAQSFCGISAGTAPGLGPACGC